MTEAQQDQSAPEKQGKMVPEKDLMAVKSRADKAEGELTSTQQELDQLRNELSQERAAKEQLEAKLDGKSVIPSEEMTALQQKLDQATKRGEELETQVLDAKRVNLVNQYNLAPGSLDDFDAVKLDAVSEALELLGSGARAAAQRFDTGVGSGEAKLTPHEMIKQELARRKQQK